jgi:hypothetical protein
MNNGGARSGKQCANGAAAGGGKPTGTQFNCPRTKRGQQRVSSLQRGPAAVAGGAGQLALGAPQCAGGESGRWRRVVGGTRIARCVRARAIQLWNKGDVCCVRRRAGVAQSSNESRVCGALRSDSSACTPCQGEPSGRPNDRGAQNTARHRASACKRVALGVGPRVRPSWAARGPDARVIACEEPLLVNGDSPAAPAPQCAARGAAGMANSYSGPPRRPRHLGHRLTVPCGGRKAPLSRPEGKAPRPRPGPRAEQRRVRAARALMPRCRGACVRACVRARVRACLHTCVRVRF